MDFFLKCYVSVWGQYWGQYDALNLHYFNPSNTDTLTLLFTALTCQEINMIYSSGDLGIEIDFDPDEPGWILHRKEIGYWHDYLVS